MVNNAASSLRVWPTQTAPDTGQNQVLAESELVYISLDTLLFSVKDNIS
jgi:hypothetical protein